MKSSSCEASCHKLEFTACPITAGSYDVVGKDNHTIPAYLECGRTVIISGKKGLQGPVSLKLKMS